MIVNGVENMENIIIHNASENNLKHITLKIPLNQFTCITGPSGCGKSSLLFDTIYAESQRSFLESISGNIFGQNLMDKPQVDHIDNLRPALSISQKYYNVNPRSTIGTTTDISYYLRTLFAFHFNHIMGSHLNINYFSPNNPTSWCPHCHGLGEEYFISEKALMPNPQITLSNGGILYYKGAKNSKERKLLEAICDFYSIDINKKLQDLTSEEKERLLYRTIPNTFHVRYKTPKGKYKQSTITERGALVELEEKLNEINIPSTFASISKYLAKRTCSICHGQKLNAQISKMKICGLSISEIEQLPLTKLQDWCSQVQQAYLSNIYYEQISQLLENIVKRVHHLIDLKLGYMSLGRSIPTLSNGELQRVRLATQLDCSLSGLIYVLDEPCKGLHYKDINAIINAIHILIQKGNTVIAIEHNKHFLNSADFIIRMGPGGGSTGGYILSAGPKESSEKYVIKYKTPREAKQYITIKNINYRNLKGLDIRLPIGCVTCISGVSGSGKSSLADIIENCFTKNNQDNYQSVLESNFIQNVFRVNQQPIGKTARSTVVSYLGIYETIREIFAKTPEAQQHKFTASDFSINIPGGRCECCQGTGKQKITLSYLADTYIICPECKGARFHQEILSIKYKGFSITDILNQNIYSLISIFKDQKNIIDVLHCLVEIGLGYISLGQMSMNLSGGEAQRIKLTKYLAAKSKKPCLYILDEPTSGLSTDDIAHLIPIINKLANDGHTIVIIEHNIEFITQIADYLIDLGNIAGNAGGTTIIEGNVQQVMENPNSSWETLLNCTV